MKWQCYSIAGSSFHFGRLAGAQEDSSVVFPSDSLFAALVHTAAQTVEKEAFDSWINEFVEGKPPFLLTSVFPRAGSVRFFPMPLLRDRIDTEALGVTLKDVKKTEFLSEELFRRVISGESCSIIYDPAETLPLQGKSVRISKAEYELLPAAVKEQKALWTSEKRARVTLDRETSASNLFFSGKVDFAPECGLWFGISEINPGSVDPDQLLENLADQGFGGLRSAGMGAASVLKTDCIELPDAGDGKWITLSRYLPAADEVPAVMEGNTAYNLDEVGGWLYSPGVKSERRRMIHLIAEGSVLNAMGKNIYGSMVDVQPDYEGTRPVGHPVWRNGYAAPVGLTERRE